MSGSMVMIFAGVLMVVLGTIVDALTQTDQRHGAVFVTWGIGALMVSGGTVAMLVMR